METLLLTGTISPNKGIAKTGYLNDKGKSLDGAIYKYPPLAMKEFGKVAFSKMLESFRISDEHKKEIRSLREKMGK